MAEETALSVDESGRILIPEGIRNKLGLSPGMTLIVEPGENGEVWLRPQPESTQLVYESGVLVVDGKLTGDVNDIVQREREHRMSDLLNRMDV